MTKFENKYFQKFNFSKTQTERYFRNALKDLKIAKKDSISEVRFTYSYQTLIKAGIVSIAKEGSVKVRSVPGHHIKILTKMSKILGSPDVLTIGNAMRMKRNKDFYSGGTFISGKEARDYLKFVEDVVKIVKKRI